nr:MAG TPA: hypothetical protein [Caudoviricetes sp.]
MSSQPLRSGTPLSGRKKLRCLGLSTDPACSFTGSHIVVDSWNNIGKYSDREHAVYLF